MLKIKDFARLCQCNTQTLRFYDKTGLLKPGTTSVKSGYRYYEKSQALDYFKIKELQNIGFTIQEIKQCIADDRNVLEAIDEKVIAIQMQLQKAVDLRETYQTRIAALEKTVDDYNELITNIDWDSQNLIFTLNETKVKVRLTERAEEIGGMIRKMMETRMISFDAESIDYMAAHTWKPSEIIFGWNDPVSFIEKTQNLIQPAMRGTLNFFYISPNISLYDVSACLDSVTMETTDPEMNLFFVSITESGKNIFFQLSEQ